MYLKLVNLKRWFAINFDIRCLIILIATRAQLLILLPVKLMFHTDLISFWGPARKPSTSDWWISNTHMHIIAIILLWPNTSMKGWQKIVCILKSQTDTWEDQIWLYTSGIQCQVARFVELCQIITLPFYQNLNCKTLPQSWWNLGGFSS